MDEEKKKVVFISGPMSGIDNYNQPAFIKAEELLSRNGYIVLNPSRLPVGLPDEKYLPIDMAMIDASDAVFVLKEWRNSKGALAEVAYALRQGKNILYHICDDDLYSISPSIAKELLTSSIGNYVQVGEPIELPKCTTTVAQSVSCEAETSATEFDGITWKELCKIFGESLDVVNNFGESCIGVADSLYLMRRLLGAYSDKK